MTGENTTVLLTGAAGFIGFHVAQKLLQTGVRVIGVDNLNPYYDPSLKERRVAILREKPNFTLHKADISDKENLENIFAAEEGIGVVCHLAAQAGVRYSLEDPFAYERSNMLGTLTVLECMQKQGVKDLVFASSSSVYGGIAEQPFHEEMQINKPMSLYAATKAGCELYARAYCSLYGMRAAGLRFFTVYGPWGRPDMALFGFTKAILAGESIDVYNNGNMKRDFTYIDDIVDGIVAAIHNVPTFTFEIFNLACGHPVPLLTFIRCIEIETGLKAQMHFKPLQPGDVPETAADITKARRLLGFEPKTQIQEGVGAFVRWYRDIYSS